MKRILVALALVTCAAVAYPQGLINFNLKAGSATAAAPGAVWAPVYLPEPGAVTVSKIGNTATGIIPGTQTYSGGFVIGTGYSAALYGGAAGTAEGSLSLIATTTFRTQTATTVAGTVSPPATAPAVAGVGVGSLAAFQLRAWDNRGGTITSWAQAVADSTIAQGKSPVFDMVFPLGNATTVPIPNLQGLQSFSLAVPEPSAIALGVLGIGALVLFRRRRN